MHPARAGCIIIFLNIGRKQTVWAIFGPWNYVCALCVEQSLKWIASMCKANLQAWKGAMQTLFRLWNGDIVSGTIKKPNMQILPILVFLFLYFWRKKLSCVQSFTIISISSYSSTPHSHGPVTRRHLARVHCTGGQLDLVWPRSGVFRGACWGVCGDV